MHAGTDGNSMFLIQPCGNLMRVNAFDAERHCTNACVSIPTGIDGNAFDFFETVNQQVGEFSLAGRNSIHPYVFEIINRRTKSNAAGDVRRSGFILCIAGCRNKAVIRNTFHHAAAKEQRFEILLPHPENTGSGWSKHLVSGEDVVVSAKGFHIHLPVRGCLCAVHAKRDSLLFTESANLFDRCHRSGNV